MTIEPGHDELEGPIQFIGTNQGILQAIIGPGAAYYGLSVDREDFEEQALALLGAWKAGVPVRVVVRGAEILSVSRTM